MFDGDSFVIGPDGEVTARGAQFVEDLVVVDLPVETRRGGRRRRPARRCRGAGDRPARAARTEDPPRARPGRRGVARGRPRHPRLLPRERVHGRGHRPVRRHRLGRRRRDRRRRARRRTTSPACSCPRPTRPTTPSTTPRPSPTPSACPPHPPDRRRRWRPSATCSATSSSPASTATDGREPGVAYENLQSRLRGLLLMALSNETGAIVLTTGNKSEYAVGYATLYGDMAGGFAPAQGRPEAAGLRHGPVAQRQPRAPARARTTARSSRPRPSTRRRPPNCGPTSATTTRCRPTRCSTPSSRATSRGCGHRRPRRAGRRRRGRGPAGRPPDRPGRVQASPGGAGPKITRAPSAATAASR